MAEPEAASIAVAYLGAGAFYICSDLTAAAWSKELPPFLAGLAMMLAALMWGPASLAATHRYARLAGWRPAFLYFRSAVAPALAIFLAGVALAVHCA